MCPKTYTRCQKTAETASLSNIFSLRRIRQQQLRFLQIRNCVPGFKHEENKKGEKNVVVQLTSFGLQ